MAIDVDQVTLRNNFYMFSLRMEYTRQNLENPHISEELRSNFEKMQALLHSSLDTLDHISCFDAMNAAWQNFMMMVEQKTYTIRVELYESWSAIDQKIRDINRHYFNFTGHCQPSDFSLLSPEDLFFIISNLGGRYSQVFKDLVFDLTQLPRLIGFFDQLPLIFFTIKNRAGNTVIHESIERVDSFVIKDLIEKIPIKALLMKNSIEQTPLHIAVNAGNLLLMEALMERLSPIEIWQTDEQGKTSLHLAAAKRNPIFLKMLFDKMPEFYRRSVILIRNKFDSTPVHAAINKGNYEVLTFILPYLTIEDLEWHSDFSFSILHLLRSNNLVRKYFECFSSRVQSFLEDDFLRGLGAQC